MPAERGPSGTAVTADPVVSPADTPEELIERLRGAANYEFGNLNEDQRNLYRAAADAIESRNALLHGADVDHAALLAVGERDKAEREGLRAEVERLRDRTVCSGCGSDVGESGVCTYPGCEEGEMIPASDLPFALRVMSENFAEDRKEWHAEEAEYVAAGERDRWQIARLTDALAFYADPASYENETPRHVRPVITDHGARARAVLAGEEDAANE